VKKKFLWLLCSITLVAASVFCVHFAYSYTYRQWDVQAERLSPRHFFPTFSSIKDVDNGSYRIEVQKVATSDGVYSVLVTDKEAKDSISYNVIRSDGDSFVAPPVKGNRNASAPPFVYILVLMGDALFIGITSLPLR